MALLKHLLAGLSAVAYFPTAAALDVNPTSVSSVSGAAHLIEQSLLSNYYNATHPTSQQQVGIFNHLPWEWWESGAAWTAFLDYYAYTHDAQYLNLTLAALRQQANPPKWDLKPSWQDSSEANDDQVFWAYAALTALEYNVPSLSCPSSSPAGPNSPPCSWHSLADSVFNQFVSRWNASTCAGGLKWQYTPTARGFYYKSSVANAGFFQLAARLARYTANTTYHDWAVRVWTWSVAVGFVDTRDPSAYLVYDGAGDAGTDNCSKIDNTTWSYNVGSFLMGAAVMANMSGYGNEWAHHAHALTAGALARFTHPSNVLYELECEADSSCNFDQYSFKGYLARWLGKAVALQPGLATLATPVLQCTSRAAAQACLASRSSSSSSSKNITCGAQWYKQGGDGVGGFPQQLAAFEAVQAVLAPRVPLSTRGAISYK